MIFDDDSINAAAQEIDPEAVVWAVVIVLGVVGFFAWV